MRTNFRGAFAGLVRGIPVTVGLVVANVVVYAAMCAIDARAGDAEAQAAYLVQWGANVGGLSFAGEPWRLFTSMFVHAGLLHLAFNSLALLEIGGVVERRVGGARMGAIYLLAGLGGSYTSARWHGFTVSVGASGAIFGLLAALIVLGYLARRPLRGPYGATVSPGRALLLGAITLAAGLFFNADNAAHLGGFATGAGLSVAALLAERARRPRRAAIAFAAAMLGAGGVLAWLTAEAYDTGLAERVHFAQLMSALQEGNAGTRIDLRRCALAAVDERNGAPRAAFAACLRQSGRTGNAAPAARDNNNRYAPLLHDGQVVWPLCIARAARLQRLGTLSAPRQAVVSAVARHCAARALLEASALPGSADALGDPAALRRDLLPYELIAAAAGGMPPAELPIGATLQREAAALAEWQASIAPEEQELASLSDCPFHACRRPWAR